MMNLLGCENCKHFCSCRMWIKNYRKESLLFIEEELQRDTCIFVGKNYFYIPSLLIKIKLPRDEIW